MSLDALTPESPVMTIEHPTVIPGGEHRWQRWTNRLLTDEDGRTILVDWMTSSRDAEWELSRLEPLAAALLDRVRRREVHLSLYDGSGSGVEFSRASARRFWRRIRPLSALMPGKKAA